MKNKPLIILLLLVTSLVGIYLLSSKNQNPQQTTNEEPVTSTNNNETSLGMYAEENAVIISDNKPGSTVTVSRIMLRKPGYVVIHENSDGKPGTIIGSSARLGSGESDGIEVTLTRPTVQGETLYAMLHFELNENDSFEASADTPVPSVVEGPVMGSFMIDENAEEFEVILP